MCLPPANARIWPNPLLYSAVYHRYSLKSFQLCKSAQTYWYRKYFEHIVARFQGDSSCLTIDNIKPELCPNSALLYNPMSVIKKLLVNIRPSLSPDLADWKTSVVYTTLQMFVYLLIVLLFIGKESMKTSMTSSFYVRHHISNSSYSCKFAFKIRKFEPSLPFLIAMIAVTDMKRNSTYLITH